MRSSGRFGAAVAAVVTLVGVVSACVSTSPPAPPPVKVHRIGWLGGGDPQPFHQEFLLGLEKHGYRVGDNVTIEYRYAHGQIEQLETLAQELVDLGVSVYLAADTPSALAARAVTPTTPIVLAVAGDPLRTGLAQSIRRPGGNVTGLSSQTVDLAAKRLEVLAELVPRLERLLVLVQAGQSAHAVSLQETAEAAAGMGIDVTAFEYAGACDVAVALDEALRLRADAVMAHTGPPLGRYRPWILQQVAERRIPVMYTREEYVEAGGLVSYAVSLGDLYRRSAGFVDKILKGADPAEIPFEYPTVLDLWINRQAAEAIGLTLPPSLLLRANKIFDRGSDEVGTAPC